MNKKNQEGITLIALIITVIVMIILAFVTTNMFIGDNGIFRKTEEGAEIYKNSANNEAEGLNDLDKKIEDIINRIDQEQQANGKEITIDINLKPGVTNVPTKGMQISVYRYADIDASGNIKVCEGFEGVDLFSTDKLVDEDFLITNTDGSKNEDSPLYQITSEEILEKGLKLANLTKQNDTIKPILTTTIENELQTLTFKSNKLDNSIWVIIVENGGYVGEDEEFAYTTAPFMGMGVVKNGKCSSLKQTNVTAEQNDLKFNVYFLSKTVPKESSLEISNKVNNYNTQETSSTFVYEIEAYKRGEKVYSNVISITQDAQGEEIALVEGIPVGAQVNVNQVYISPSYTCISGTTKKYAQSSEMESVQFIHELNNKQTVKSSNSCVRIYYNKESEEWEHEITEAIEGDGNVQTIFNNLTLQISISNLTQEGKMVRVKYFTKADVTVLDKLGWEKKADGYYYYTQALQEGEVCETFVMPINLPETAEDFNVVTVIEMTKALTNENGGAYGNWDS